MRTGGPRAPMVLRGKPVGEQDAADQRRAFDRRGRSRGASPSSRFRGPGPRGEGTVFCDSGTFINHFFWHICRSPNYAKRRVGFMLNSLNV